MCSGMRAMREPAFTPSRRSSGLQDILDFGAGEQEQLKHGGAPEQREKREPSRSGNRGGAGRPGTHSLIGSCGGIHQTPRCPTRTLAARHDHVRLHARVVTKQTLNSGWEARPSPQAKCWPLGRGPKPPCPCTWDDVLLLASLPTQVVSCNPRRTSTCALKYYAAASRPSPISCALRVCRHKRRVTLRQSTLASFGPSRYHRLTTKTPLS